MPTVTALYVYPVKSCMGIKLEAAIVNEKGDHAYTNHVASFPVDLWHVLSLLNVIAGFAFDRTWVVALSANGKFQTQRQLPKCGNTQTHHSNLAL